MNRLRQRLLNRMYKIVDAYKASKVTESIFIDFSIDSHKNVYRFSLSTHGRGKFMASWALCGPILLDMSSAELQEVLLVSKIKNGEQITDAYIERDSDIEKLLELMPIVEKWWTIKVKQLDRC